MTEPIFGTPILGTAIFGTNQLQPVEWEGVAYCSSTVQRAIYSSLYGFSANIPTLVFFDLIGEKNQVMLEYLVNCQDRCITYAYTCHYCITMIEKSANDF